MKREPVFETEAALCAAFIAWATLEGYVCYPETAGFDILLVDKNGFQIGVEAKLRLNVKVITQALPSYEAAVGPDHRAVLVPELDGCLRTLCAHIGVAVFYCTTRHLSYKTHHFARDALYVEELFDWNPVRRCTLPAYVPDVPAGVPAPVQLTPWKIGALKVLAQIAIAGSITRQQISAFGIDPRRWCSGDHWLIPLDGDPKRGGRWVRGPKCPAFDAQHPDVFARIKAELLEAGPPPGQEELEVA